MCVVPSDGEQHTFAHTSPAKGMAARAVGLVSRAAPWDPMRPRAEATRIVGLQVQTRADGQLAAGWGWRRQ